MPHIVVEFTDSVNPTDSFRSFFEKCHDILEQGGVPRGNCKSRAVQLSEYATGGKGEIQPFVHLSLALLEGRGAEFLRDVGEKIMDLLSENFISDSGVSDPEFTLEIREMKKNSYFKLPEGTLG
ncbi:MAG: hypothetical protein OEY63_02405 [Gemmatimonadota bacterium]|nr:hypothetical protein [Gemmatimonadota bacterium]MDH5804043.1 hypothetical protein [Gemmatimonadota bacterium]